MNRRIASIAGLTLALALPGKGAFARDLPTSRHAPETGRADVPTDEPKVSSFAVRGTSIERVRATVAVNVPAERVRSVVFDFARYPEFMPSYKKASMIRSTPAGGRSVRLD